MSKTYRDSTAIARKVMRRPKGHKAAKINEVRKSAIPPSDYEDKQLNGECHVPWDVAYKLYDEGKTQEQIEKLLVKRFKIKNSDARYMFLSIKKNRTRFVNHYKKVQELLDSLEI